jgi:hypothetical protein
MTNIVVSKKRTVQISANSTAGIISTSTPVVLKNNPIGIGVTRLDNLTDVDATSETDKATLVYDSNQDKYIVKQLEFSDISGEIDGGIF